MDAATQIEVIASGDEFDRLSQTLDFDAKGQPFVMLRLSGQSQGLITLGVDADRLWIGRCVGRNLSTPGVHALIVELARKLGCSSIVSVIDDAGSKLLRRRHGFRRVGGLELLEV